MVQRPFRSQGGKEVRPFLVAQTPSKHLSRACFSVNITTVSNRPVAQLVEHRSPKPEVAGSSPVGPAKTSESLASQG